MITNTTKPQHRSPHSNQLGRQIGMQQEPVKAKKAPWFILWLLSLAMVLILLWPLQRYSSSVVPAANIAVAVDLLEAAAAESERSVKKPKLKPTASNTEPSAPMELAGGKVEQAYPAPKPTPTEREKAPPQALPQPQQAMPKAAAASEQTKEESMAPESVATVSPSLSAEAATAVTEDLLASDVATNPAITAGVNKAGLQLPAVELQLTAALLQWLLDSKQAALLVYPRSESTASTQIIFQLSPASGRLAQAAIRRLTSADLRRYSQRRMRLGQAWRGQLPLLRLQSETRRATGREFDLQNMVVELRWTQSADAQLATQQLQALSALGINFDEVVKANTAISTRFVLAQNQQRLQVESVLVGQKRQKVAVSNGF